MFQLTLATPDVRSVRQRAGMGDEDGLLNCLVVAAVVARHI